ncbi:hypothetical protein QBC34DRAFT_106783 [Podospora aff. communis PSN243]|uniref:Gag1-like clamp domain-containing protein n=1 Tax=Podospora aff. communis PSN243 TaxID=3040156 RepID=A0AAV9H319_9PEZI|nr:hypothetical protein QBC34DRAFT_106783 [Podospora aff. communis PSN243]
MAHQTDRREMHGLAVSAAPSTSAPSKKTLPIPAALGDLCGRDAKGLELPCCDSDEVTVTSRPAAPPTAVPPAAIDERGLECSGGQQDIIPLLAERTPHNHHHDLEGQPPSYKGPIPLEAHAADRGDPELSTSHQDTTLPNMIFSDLYRSPRSPFSKLRNAHPHAVALPPDLDADLVSKDKTRQKDAVKRYLTERIRNDWDFVWPPPPTAQPTAAGAAPAAAPQPGVETSGAPVVDDHAGQPLAAMVVGDREDGAIRDPGEEADSESDAESVYSTISEDPVHFRPRAEWTSDLSDDEPRAAASPFRFDNPDSVGSAVTSSILEKRARRRRAVREEASWNPGLACFEARRNAWTGAKTARVKPKPPSPMSPTSGRRLSFWRHNRSESSASHNGGFSSGSPPTVASPLSPTATRTSQQTDASTAPSDHDSGNSLSRDTTGSGAKRTSSQDSAHELYAVETLLPIPPPLLPPQNPMRASVTPSIYPSLYDKIVVHSLQPSCPVNLADMLRACVVGWKRDGEWPPRPTMVAPVLTATDLAAMRHRKAVAAREQHARKASTATAGSSRRLSFVGFLGGGNKEEKEKDKDKGSGSDGAGKAIRRSLQKVFSLGHVGHANGATAVSPTSPNSTVPAKEVTAAG